MTFSKQLGKALAEELRAMVLVEEGQNIGHSMMMRHMANQGYKHVASSLHGQAIERGSDSADEHHFEHPSGKKLKAKKYPSGWSIQEGERRDLPKNPNHPGIKPLDFAKVGKTTINKKK